MKRIVLLEPHDDVRTMLAASLELLGYEVASARSSPVAANLIAEADADIFVAAPEAIPDPYELLARVRRRADAPLLIVASSSTPLDAAPREHFDAELTKPYDVGELHALITSWYAPALN